MDLQKAFTHYIKTENLFQQKDRLILAVSGGVDSVVLTDLCKKAGYDFIIAHCNFQLRGDESEGDEFFVKELAGTYGAAFFVKKFDTEQYAGSHRMNIQAAARVLRYTWFLALMKENESLSESILLTAHHANDNIETVLMNFFKGTGIAGLKGMAPVDGGLVRKTARPLLFATKESLLQYAKDNQLAWREDASNFSNKYTRNYFRNELIPALQTVYPEVEHNLLENISRFKEINQLYQQAIDANRKKLVEIKGNEIYLPVLKLARMEALQTVLFEILSEYGFLPGHVPEVIKLLQAESGKFVASPGYRIFRNRKWLIISPRTDLGQSHFLIEEGEKEISFSDKKLNITKNKFAGKFNTNIHVIEADAARIVYPLLLRKWKQGDYFYPLGMKKKKKLSRFLTDQKLSLSQKEQTWVIESDKRIVGVPGMRIDDRFRITDLTKEVISFTLLSAQ